MRLKLAVTFALFFAAAAASADITGVWTAAASDSKPGRVHLSVRRDDYWDMGMGRDLSSLIGLTEAQLHSTQMVPVQFELRSEAGNASFDGTFRDGDGAGHFVFHPDSRYFDTLRSIGVDPEMFSEKHDDDWKLLTLAMLDISTAYIKSMREAGYNEPLKTYVSMRIQGVTLDFVRELRELGFRDVPARELIALRIHGVTPDYIRRMRAGGADPSLRELISSRIHGATPEFAEAMRRLGYDNLSQNDLVSFRIHGVSEDFIKDLRQLGYDRVAARDLVSMRIHGVTPEYIRELQAAGYRDLPIQKMISLRIHGLDAKTIEDLNRMK
jgi:hypothetical protein